MFNSSTQPRENAPAHKFTRSAGVLIAAAMISVALSACGSSTSSDSSTSTTEHVAQQGTESKSRPEINITGPATPSSVALSVSLPEGATTGSGGWVALGTNQGGHMGSVIATAAVQEGDDSHVTLRMTPAVSAGTYIVGLFDTRTAPTPSDRALVSEAVSIADGEAA